MKTYVVLLLCCCCCSTTSMFSIYSVLLKIRIKKYSRIEMKMDIYDISFILEFNSNKNKKVFDSLYDVIVLFI